LVIPAITGNENAGRRWRLGGRRRHWQRGKTSDGGLSLFGGSRRIGGGRPFPNVVNGQQVVGDFVMAFVDGKVDGAHAEGTAGVDARTIGDGSAHRAQVVSLHRLEQGTCHQ